MEAVSDVAVCGEARLATSVATANHRGVPLKVLNSGEVDSVFFEVGSGFVGIPLVVSVVCMEVVDHVCCDRYVLILNKCTEYMGDARFFSEVSRLRLNWDLSDWSDGK